MVSIPSNRGSVSDSDWRANWLKDWSIASSQSPLIGAVFLTSCYQCVFSMNYPGLNPL
ncbi:hypothetical protein MTBBW1_2790006 [Desulfamplus magnetovallimortis]|uniref:Uncharacterized protein n=1 Tax=Desulfamplus magnetovallimortis TaxID=1246637 RepID=A0A1W1HF90_9BACT|nr:hypothetical protein MTBBW1_2790006 [Desulfamplus magnetovallimortis]